MEHASPSGTNCEGYSEEIDCLQASGPFQKDRLIVNLFAVSSVWNVDHSVNRFANRIDLGRFS